MRLYSCVFFSLLFLSLVGVVGFPFFPFAFVFQGSLIPLCTLSSLDEIF